MIILLFLMKVFQFIKNNLLICSGTKENNLYKITLNLNTLLNTEFINDEPIPKRVKLDVNKTYLWHLRLCHINQTRIEKLVKDEPLKELNVTPLPTCESCLEGKMTKRSFLSKGHQTNDLLELVHSNICGPFNVQAQGGYEYFVTFIDDYSRYGYVYLIHRKSETFETFKEFRAEMEKQLGKPIKALQLDRGGEYLDEEFKSYLTENKILSQLAAPGTPQQNSVA